MANTLRQQENAKRAELATAEERLGLLGGARELANAAPTGPGSTLAHLNSINAMLATSFPDLASARTGIAGMITAQIDVVQRLREQVAALKEQADAFDANIAAHVANGMSEDEALATMNTEERRKAMLRTATIIVIAMVLLAAGTAVTWWIIKRMRA